MIGPAGALASLVRPLPEDEREPGGRWVAASPGRGLRLLVGGPQVGRGELVAGARLAGSPATSHGKAAGRRALAVAATGRVGVDIETLARVALNARAVDGWLAPAERVLVARAAAPVVELACHWVLKEALGKALGVGLAMPLDLLAFGADDRLIVLRGPAAPAVRNDWRFGLYHHGPAIIGLAWRRSADPVRPRRQEAAGTVAPQVQRP